MNASSARPPGDGLATLGQLATGPTWKAQVRQETAAAITYSAGWSQGSSTIAFGGGIRFTSKANASRRTAP